jgi:hypothetical protein
VKAAALILHLCPALPARFLHGGEVAVMAEGDDTGDIGLIFSRSQVYCKEDMHSGTSLIDSCE